MTQFLHSGTAPETTLASGITDASTTIDLAAGTGYPSPTGGKLTAVVIDPETSKEEHVYYDTRSGNQLQNCVRGQDGTSAFAHDSGAVVRHIFTAEEADAASTAAVNTTGRIDAANQLLVSDSATTLAKLAVAASRLVGRKATGDVGALTAAEVKTLLALALDDLSDVDTTSVAPTDGQALVWDDGDSLWVPGTVDSGTSGGPDLVHTVVPPTIVQVSAHISNTNRAIFARVVKGGTITAIGIEVAVQSGNISAAVCRGGAGRAAPTSRVVTTGAISCPAAGFASLTIASTAVDETTDWLALSADNTTATFKVSTGTAAGGTNMQLGYLAYQDTAHPIPSTPATSTFAAANVPILIGVP